MTRSSGATAHTSLTIDVTANSVANPLIPTNPATVLPGNAVTVTTGSGASASQVTYFAPTTVRIPA